MSSTPIGRTKYSLFFEDIKLDGNDQYLFDYVNLAWNAYKGKCYGQVVVQFPPLDIDIPKGCYHDVTALYEPAPTTDPDYDINVTDPGVTQPEDTVTPIDTTPGPASMWGTTASSSASTNTATVIIGTMDTEEAVDSNENENSGDGKNNTG
eukprot:158402_1